MIYGKKYINESPLKYFLKVGCPFHNNKWENNKSYNSMEPFLYLPYVESYTCQYERYSINNVKRPTCGLFIKKQQDLEKIIEYDYCLYNATQEYCKIKFSNDINDGIELYKNSYGYPLLSELIPLNSGDNQFNYVQGLMLFE